MKQTLVITIEIPEQSPEVLPKTGAYPYRLIVNREDGSGYTLAGQTCHDTKSTAGYIFQSDKVRVVKVIDIDGREFLFLHKELKHLNFSIPSEEAKYG